MPFDHAWYAAGSTGLFVVAGPCVAESREVCLRSAATLARAGAQHGITMLFKASYDKANRTSADSFRGPGIDEGLRILEEVRQVSGLPILTDVHESGEVAAAAQVADVLQIPAYLCRQTSLLAAAGATGKVVNVKKGQFMAPGDMRFAVAKAGPLTWVTERGTFFGYNRLVVDFAAYPVLRSLGCPLVFDATHSVQSPGGGEGCSSGNRSMALPLARAALAVGFDGLFFEVHPDPDNALCDGPNSLPLDDFARAVPGLIELYRQVRDA